METIAVTIEGTAPLLMHNQRLANPLDPYTIALKKLTAKRQKTQDDHEQIARAEFLGSLYYDKATGVYMPGQNIEACLRDGAKLKRRGAMVQRGLTCPELYIPLLHKGPKSAEQLWDIEKFRDIRGVIVGGKRIMRCRPYFVDWQLAFTLWFQPDIIDADVARQCLHDAGEQTSLGDYRPRYGRFAITQWKVNGNGR